MKKILSLIVTLVLMLVFTSCTKDVKKNLENNEEITPTKEIALMEGTKDVSENISNDGRSFKYFSDIDYDGEEETIEMEVNYRADGYNCYLDVKAGDKKSSFELVDGYISKVYFCDIDKTDNAHDVVVLTTEGSDDPCLRIISYADDLNCYQFAFEDYMGDRKTYVAESNWIGYACTHYFNLNDDGSITIEEQTGVCGMWSVHRTYSRNKHGIFVEVKPDKYKILPDFMENHSYYSENISRKEAEMWEKGYILAYESYDGGNIKISKGEYFKPTHDDGYDKLYIEKENGEKGYLVLNYDTHQDISMLNQYFFFLAG